MDVCLLYFYFFSNVYATGSLGNTLDVLGARMWELQKGGYSRSSKKILWTHNSNDSIKFYGVYKISVCLKSEFLQRISYFQCLYAKIT